MYFDKSTWTISKKRLKSTYIYYMYTKNNSITITYCRYRAGLGKCSVYLFHLVKCNQPL